MGYTDYETRVICIAQQYLYHMVVVPIHAVVTAEMKSTFYHPLGICRHNILIFSCDSSNDSICVIDDRDVVKEEVHNNFRSRSATHSRTLSPPPTSFPLQKPFYNCLGRKCLLEYPDLYIGDTKQEIVFRITDVNQCLEIHAVESFISSTQGLHLTSLSFLQD